MKMVFMGLEEMAFTVFISVISGIAGGLTVKLVEYLMQDELAQYKVK